MKVAVYNRFLQSMGGGERHSGMLAQVLADDGHDVDLVGHEDVGKEILADHLGLNLGKVTMRIVPDRGEEAVARLSSEYELFVNGSYMSRVKAQAPRNLYLCYFPTPFDHDLAGWQRRLVRVLGPHVRFYDLPLLEFLCRQAGLEVEETGTNPANHPGPPPEYLGPEPVVHPPLDDLVERAMGKLRASLDHRDRRGRVTDHHDPEWAYELAHVVKALAGRLQETTEALRELHRAHDKLLWGLYQSNETYVVARG